MSNWGQLRLIEAGGGDQQQVWTSRETDTDQQQTKYKREGDTKETLGKGKQSLSQDHDILYIPTYV